jgi:hypothetical protein
VDDRLYSKAGKSKQDEIAAALNDSPVSKESAVKLEHSFDTHSSEKESSQSLDKSEDETPAPVFPLPEFIREPSALLRAHGMSNSVSPDMEIGT